ncbi:Threonine synthase [Haemophilus influenzae HK1212]|uniref:Threonine synthase n=1 Tax=Haemophilus influenzae HK1212 TaxID=456482 RepID=A0A7G2JYS0_HAEIF|nr:Threonine synthase [Haemophilus influenzae HK1212]
MIKSETVRKRFAKILTSNIRNILQKYYEETAVVRHWDYIEVRSKNEENSEELFKRNGWDLTDLGSGMLSDSETEDTLKAMQSKGYLCEPHGAIAYQVLKDQLKASETGIFLCTAHPAKFKESVERILGIQLPLPETLDKHNQLPLLSDEMDNDFAQLRAYLLKS